VLRSHSLLFGLSTVLGAVLGQTGAVAATHVLTYNVEHPAYGIIGTYTNIISENRDAAEVRTDLHVAVRVIGIPLFHQDARRQERWQGQRLVAFQSSTDDNGTRIEVSGQAVGDHFVIRSTSNGTLTAPAQVHPSNPWSPFLLQSGTLMSTKTGRLNPVVVKDTGDVNVTLDGRPRRLRQWFIDGEKHQVVWIDGRGVIAAFQTQENGQTINFVLKSDTAEDEATARLPEP